MLSVTYPYRRPKDLVNCGIAETINDLGCIAEQLTINKIILENVLRSWREDREAGTL